MLPVRQVSDVLFGRLIYDSNSFLELVHMSTIYMCRLYRVKTHPNTVNHLFHFYLCFLERYEEDRKHCVITAGA